jgi:hypothetical protein
MTEPRPHTESELVDYVRSIDVPAPQELHDRIEELVSERTAPRRRGAGVSPSPRTALGRRLAAGLALAAAVAAVLAVSLSGGGGGGVTVSEASVLTLRAATAAAPTENGRSGTQLNASLDGISFPYWEDRFGWRATGARVDQIGGRTIRTVFYANARGQRIGYAIVAGTPAPQTSGGSSAWRGGARYVLLSQGDVRIVTWLRDGRRCVVAGRGVSAATLLMLASWNAHGPTAS